MGNDHHSDHHHGHSHGPGHHHHHATGRISTALALNVTFTVIELVGAWFTQSTAIAADALHDLGDSVALALAWGAERIAQGPASERFTFGLRRMSLLGALINAVILLVGGVVVLSEAVPRLWEPQTPHAGGMAGLAVLGIAVNGFAAWRVNAGSSMNERIVTWHLIEDVLGWVAVLVVSMVMMVSDLPILDPILAILVTLFVGYNAARHLRSTVEVFLQAMPHDLTLAGVREALQAVAGVASVQHLHVWSQDGEHHVLTGRLSVARDATLAEADEIRTAAREALHEIGVDHATLEIVGNDVEAEVGCA